MKRHSLYIFALSALALSGCQKNGLKTVYTEGDSIVRFTPSVVQTGVSTKGELINTSGADKTLSEISSLTEFTVSAWDNSSTPVNIIPAGTKVMSRNSGAYWITVSCSGTKVTYAEISDGDILNLQPSWSVGDVVTGFDSSKATYTFSVTSVAADGVATLYGEAPSDCALHLIYLYGASASSITDGSLTVDYTGQAGDKTMPAVMLADGTVSNGVGSFVFKNAGAVIGFDALKGIPQGTTISGITIKGENLSGAGVALDGSSKLALTATAKAGDTYREQIFIRVRQDLHKRGRS